MMQQSIDQTTIINFFARTPNLLLYGLPDVAMQDKWALITLIGLCWERPLEAKNLKELEGPYKLSLRDIEQITGIKYSALRSYGQKTQRTGVLDRLHHLGYITVVDGTPITDTGRAGRTQTYLYIHLEKIWLDNQQFSQTARLSPCKRVSSDSFTVNHVNSKDETLHDDTVNHANNVVNHVNSTVNHANSSKSHGTALQAGLLPISDSYKNNKTIKTLQDNTKNNSAEANASGALFDVSSTPEKPKKKRTSLKEKLANLETFDFEQPVTIESIMQLGDYWRGGRLPQVKRADSDYQKALLQGATPLSQRRRNDGSRGYSLKEIDNTIRFLKRIAPEGKPWLIADDWWIGKNVDLWVVAKNIDRVLARIEQLEKAHNITLLPTNNNTPEEDYNILWTYEPDHEGPPEDNWYRYQMMPKSVAMNYKLDFYGELPGETQNTILRCQQEEKNGTRKRPITVIAS